MSDQPTPKPTPPAGDDPKLDVPKAGADKPIQLPDDHPLVTALATQKDQIRDLKAQLASAGDASKTTEQRLAELEQRAVKAEREALVRSIQAKHSIADEDAELFLTGADKESLEAQAKRLAERDAERKKRGNHVPSEGKTPSDAKKESSWAGVLNQLDEKRQT